MNKLNFNLEDFFPYYTDSSLKSDQIDPIYDSNFYTTILRKKEFNECKSQPTDNPSEEGDAWPHQLFMARFMSPNTPYQNMLVFHGMGTGKCVFPDTKIRYTSGQELKIEELWDFNTSPLLFDKLGCWKKCSMPIHTYDISTSTIVEREVKHIYRQLIKEEAVKYSFVNGMSLKCTKQHKIYTLSDGFTNTPRIGDAVVTLSGETTTLIGVTYFAYTGYVYDIEVDETHCYFANGILTHNTCLMAAVSEYAKSILPSLSKTIILVKNDTLKKSVIDEIATKCTGDKYNSTIDPKTGKPLTVESRLIRISAAVSKNYSVMTYYDFAKTLKNVDMSMYNNCYIIIDEAHNLRSRKSHAKTGINSYKLIHKCLHTIVGSKVLLLTGTPMRNSSSELVSLLNLILPMNKQLSEDNWNQLMFAQSSDNLSEYGIEKLKEVTYGIVSYLRSPTGNVNIQYMGNIEPPLRFTKTYTLEMDKFQTEKYALYYDKDKLKETQQQEEEDEEEEEDDDYKKSLWLNSRQASSFIFPNGECGIIAEKKYLDIDYGGDTSKSRIYDVQCSKLFLNFLTAEGTDNESILSQIKKCSIKFWFTLKQILENPTKKTFIYSSFVMGGGIILFAALLKVFQFTSAPIKGFRTEEAYPQARRFLLLSSKTLTGEQMRVGVREIFNSRENVDGDYIQVILGSRIIGEGISFFHIRQMFMLTPNWNNATTEQVIARAIRADSHPDWMQDRHLDIYRLDAKPIMIYYKQTKKLLTPESIDSIMYTTSETKDIRIKQVERILKQSAVDCALHRSRNINSNDVPNSIQCDYMSQCNYDCLYVDPKYNSTTWSKSIDSITDTYHSYFAFRQVFKLAEKIKECFSSRQSYDFNELLEYLGQYTELSSFITPIILSRTLHFLIGNNIKIKNHFGFINYLREDNNLYFLVDDASSSTNYTMSYYAAHPTYDSSYIEQSSVYHPSVVCMDYYNEESTVKRIYNLLQKHSDDIRMIQTILLNCDPLVTNDWIENAYDDYMLYKEDAPKLSKYIYQTFKNVIRIIDIKGEKTPVNFYNKYMIRIRLPVTNEWINTTEEEQELILQKRLEQVQQIKEKFGYYAIVDEQGTFRIKEVAPIQFTQKGEIDSRIARELGALKCGTGKLAKGGLIYRIFVISLKANEYGMNGPLDSLHATPVLPIQSTEFTTLIKPFIHRYLLEEQIYNRIIQLNKDQRRILFKDMYNSLPQKSDDSKLLLRSIIQAKQNTTVDYLSDENCKAIIRELEDVTFLQNALQATVKITDENYYTSLPLSVKESLAKVIKYKSLTVCESLRLWFEENGLTL